MNRLPIHAAAGNTPAQQPHRPIRNGMLVLLAIAASAALCSCSRQQTPDTATDSAGTQLRVTATIFPCYDLARAIAGTDTGTDITLLVKPGMEVHSFDPSPADILAIQNSDVFLYIGGESDEWVHRILEAAGENTAAGHKMPHAVKLIDCVETVGEDIFPETDGGSTEHSNDAPDGTKADTHEPDTHGHGHEADEHIWTSPRNMMHMLDACSAALVYAAEQKNAPPELSESYRKNAAAYKAEILAVDNELHDTVSRAAKKQIVMGDRFPLRYFADELELTYTAAFSGCSTAVEASPATIAALIDTVKTEKLPAVFAIEMSNRKIAAAIAESAGVPVLELHSCHNVSRDDFKNNETYISLMRRNNAALQKGLN